MKRHVTTHRKKYTKRYINKWFNFNFNGVNRRARCIDIEFESGVGPLFLFQTSYGNKFWLTRREIKDHEVMQTMQG